MIPINYHFPYSSQRMPLFADNLVATSQPLAAQAGLQMLYQGGNAVDAALATAIALTVVEPTSNGIGSDAFCILWDGERLHGLNASGRSPKRLNATHFKDKERVGPFGWDAVTVPGCVSAWVMLSERFGKLPFEKLFEPAIRYAREGFLVSPITASAWARSVEAFKNFSDFQAFTLNGRAPLAGERFSFEDQAQSLEKIASSRGKSFYEGELAEAMVSHAKASGGFLREDDLAEHQAAWVTPLAMNYGDKALDIKLHEIPPNGQGIAALIALGILRYHDLKQYPVDSADSFHLQIEAMKLAFADAHRYVADPKMMAIDPQSLLDEAYLAERARLISLTEARTPNYGIPNKGGTVYLSTADKKGMMVSFIQSNYMGFGSGVVVPKTGISLQNRGAGFVLTEGHPNQVAGGKRPFHTIIPAFLTAKDQPLMSFGVMGGPMQPQGHIQMVIRLVDYQQNPQSASDAPRWQVMEHGQVMLEKGISQEVREDLSAKGHQLMVENPQHSAAMGGAQLIYKLEAGGYVTGSDHRKDGQAVGF
ncbi:MAG: gamma-glutamyltransferase family protein [Deinococcales bacterium]